MGDLASITLYILYRAAVRVYSATNFGTLWFDYSWDKTLSVGHNIIVSPSKHPQSLVLLNIALCWVASLAYRPRRLSPKVRSSTYIQTRHKCAREDEIAASSPKPNKCVWATECVERNNWKGWFCVRSIDGSIRMGHMRWLWIWRAASICIAHHTSTHTECVIVGLYWHLIRSLANNNGSCLITRPRRVWVYVQIHTQHMFHTSIHIYIQPLCSGLECTLHSIFFLLGIPDS